MSIFIGPDYWSHEPFFSRLKPASQRATEKAARNAKLTAEPDRQNERERIARDYLRGKAPFIQSSSLRGPFDTKSGWENPWITGNQGASPETIRESGADTHDCSYIAVGSGEGESILTTSNLEAIDTAGQCNQKRLASNNWLRKDDGHKRLKLDGRDHSPTPSTRRVRGSGISSQGHWSYQKYKSPMTASLRSMPIYARQSGIQENTLSKSTPLLTHIQPSKDMQKESPIHEHHHELLSSGCDPAHITVSNPSRTPQQTSKSTNVADEISLDLNFGSTKYRKAADDTNISDCSGSFKYHKISQKKNEETQDQSPNSTLDTSTTSSPVPGTSNGIGLGISISSMTTKREQPPPDETDVSASKMSNKRSRQSLTEGWIESQEIDDVTSNNLPDHDHSPDPLAIDISRDGDANSQNFRSSNPSAAAPKQEACPFIAVRNRASSLEPGMHRASEQREMFGSETLNSLRAQSPDVLNLPTPEVIEPSSYQKSSSQSQALLNCQPDALKKTRNSIACVSQRQTAPEVQSPWQVGALDSSSVKVDLTSVSSTIGVSDNSNASLLNAAERSSSMEPEPILPQQSSPSQYNPAEVKLCDDLVPSRPFLDLMSPSPSREKEIRSENRLPSTQLLIDTATSNPWASDKASARTSKVKKRVSFGLPTESVEGCNIATPIPETRQEKKFDKITNLDVGDGATTHHSLRDEATRKAGKHSWSESSAIPSSPAIEAMAEAFVAADRETTSNWKMSPSIYHESKFKRNTGMPSHLTSDEEDTVGGQHMPDGFQNLESRRIDTWCSDDLTFAISPSGLVSTVQKETDSLDEQSLGVVIEEMEDFLENWDVDTEIKKARVRVINSGTGDQDSITREHLSPVWNR